MQGNRCRRLDGSESLGVWHRGSFQRRGIKGAAARRTDCVEHLGLSQPHGQSSVIKHLDAVTLRALLRHCTSFAPDQHGAPHATSSHMSSPTPSALPCAARDSSLSSYTTFSSSFSADSKRKQSVDFLPKRLHVFLCSSPIVTAS
jgi:hypothetical protein